jgi:hypothetical protein
MAQRNGVSQRSAIINAESVMALAAAWRCVSEMAAAKIITAISASENQWRE